MREWAIVPFGSEESLELTLSTCTGIFGYQKGRTTKDGGPFLVVHSPTLPVLGLQPEMDMVLAMSAEEFIGEADKRISLAEILKRYREGLEEDTKLGVYMVNGLRGVHSDLAVARYFIARSITHGDYELMGADLGMGEIVRAEFRPREQRIDVCRGLETQPMFSYQLEKRYEVSLGK